MTELWVTTRIDRETLYLAAARAYCLARFDYGTEAVYAPGGRERHIDSDARSTAQQPELRAAVDAALDEVLGRD